ncbi:hypothetical protein [Streptomonospora salina]|uniref:Uncharacterized protein n=1 Tax=Streptomonospora salina TaxID=104205 RepID=A0A841E763_9ACTN|nr:hypothetical protein [Streptomonospora salina]MBB5996963.1 hypothetical protein [Streptomonospora salina]
MKKAGCTRQVNTNPVVIRRLAAQLRTSGLADSRRGAGAGSALFVRPVFAIHEAYTYKTDFRRRTRADAWQPISAVTDGHRSLGSTPGR